MIVLNYSYYNILISLMSHIVKQDNKNPQQVVQSEVAATHPKEEDQCVVEKQTPSQQMDRIWQELTKTTDMQRFCCLVKEYCVVMVASQDDEIFVRQFFIN